ncbi:hypothetical protein DFA_03984 [Cavenderia fasciculata]|uniref:ER membrane protein complex subunit 10 n=1 Tax=Cavenderia fasciculata TaxID=261658 RepID=F4Q0Y9_CACFS|nr:uncharacterized protein DFA_03984 [Cavenderia fasciculata]EGG18490.1 hypothetical protein DFA_03984 [Cavenderia fasciculata]|eukprot:XP_004366394.1 hypothetical protein DFA_03984 [Cavenderia fasciculata]
MMKQISITLFILFVTLSVVFAQSSNAATKEQPTQQQQPTIPTQQQQIKDIIYTVKHLNSETPRCTITFKARLVIGNNENNGLMNSNDKRKVITTTCVPLTPQQKIEYQEQAEVLTTTIQSDLTSKDSKPVLASLPRRILNDSSLQYETVKLHLDATNLNLIGVSHYLTESPVSNTPKESVYVEISVTTMAQKPAIEPPKTEKEAEEQQQSFIGKYWYFIVPLVLISLVNAIMPTAGGEGEGAATGAAVAAKKK